MNEILWVLLGILVSVIVLLVGYFIFSYIRIFKHKGKINNILLQIKGQLDIKHVLLDEIDEKKYKDIKDRLNSYNLINKNVDLLKDFNEVYVYYMHSFNDDLISKQCNESEEKINYIKGYYNELVCFFNRYKSNGINAFLTRKEDVDLKIQTYLNT